MVKKSTKKSDAATVRRPPGPATTNSASSADATDGMSPLGSAWVHEPPNVPRCRIAGSATRPAVCDSSGTCAVTRSWCMTSCVVTAAPTSSEEPSSVTWRISSTPLTSTSTDGAFSRSRSTGSSDCPPPRTFESSPPATSAATASSTEPAFT